MNKIRISRCEEQVMSVIWNAEEELDLKQTMERVNEKFGHEWKPQTVSTFLTRLMKKNFLLSRKEGRYTYYHPAIEKEDYKRVAVEELEWMFDELHVNYPIIHRNDWIVVREVNEFL